MWHKPCRTFHLWCLCIKTRCLFPLLLSKLANKQQSNTLVRAYKQFTTSFHPLFSIYFHRDFHAPSQWEVTLHCNVASHWLGASTKWSLVLLLVTKSSVSINNWYHITCVQKHNAFHEISVTGLILGMGSANERWHYNVTWCLTGWAHTQNDPWVCYLYVTALSPEFVPN